MNEKILNKIISVAYSDAGLVGRIHVYLLAKKYPEVREKLIEYRRTARLVHEIRSEAKGSEKPEFTTKATENRGAFWLDLYTVLFVHPYRSIIAVIVIGVVMASAMLFYKPEPKRNYSKREIEQANYQAKETLAMVGNILNRTSSSVIKEVIPEKVSKPLNNSFSVLKNLIYKEKRNENYN